MLNKKELEKIIVNSAEDLKPFKGKDLQDKYLVMKATVKSVKLGTLEGCVIEGGGITCRKLSKCNVDNSRYIYADEARMSVFNKCEELQLGDVDEEYEIVANRFCDCGSIMITYANVEDCIFSKFEALHLVSVEMKNCIIADIVCEGSNAISMEDGLIEECSFENIELRNDSYLIEGNGAPLVEDSVFKNIRTSRKDKEIFHQEETVGKVFKRKKEFCFVDTDSCPGLMLIADLDGNIEIGYF